MHPRNWIAACLLLASPLPAALPGPVADGAEAEPPNVVLVLIDDLGWNNLGFMPGEGSVPFVTPYIDALAGESLVFHHAYANAPNCAPSRAALMSGMWAQRTGVYSVKLSERGPAEDRRVTPVPNREALLPEVVTIAEVLAGAGYRTAHVGKWHLGGEPETLPTGQGFEVNVAGRATGRPDAYINAEGEHLTRHLTDRAIALIEEYARGERPFFLHMSYYAVHSPFEPEPELRARTAQRFAALGDAAHADVLVEYAALVEGVDAQIGRLLAALDELGLADDTLVVLASDNGGPSRGTHQRPLRGAKGNFYEGGVRVPLVVRWPGRVAADTRSDVPVQLFDLYPTLAELAGAELSPGQPVDGRSLVPLLRGESLPTVPLFWHFPAYLEAARGSEDGPRPGWRATPCSMVRDGRWKLIESFEDGRLELFDLEADPSETTNLAEREPDRARALADALAAWRARTAAPLPK